MEKLIQILLETQRAQQETNNALSQQQIWSNQLNEQEIQQMARTKPKAEDFIPNLGVDDEVEGYLDAFEATAARKGWPKACGLDSWPLFTQVRPLKHFKI